MGTNAIFLNFKVMSMLQVGFRLCFRSSKIISIPYQARPFHFGYYPNMPKKQISIYHKLRSVSNIGYLVHTHDSSCLETKDRKSFNYSNKNEKLMRLVEL